MSTGCNSFCSLMLYLATREYLLCLSGKVEIDIHFALGVFQDVSEDTDYFTELAVFTTRLSVKDTSQVS